MNTLSPLELLEEITRYIHDAQTHLQRGELVALDGMEIQVRKLCDSALALNQEQRRDFASSLQEVYDALVVLETDLKNARDAIAESMKSTHTHLRAHIAYRSTDAVDGGGK